MNAQQIRITISGPVSAMKSPIAKKIREALATARPNLTVAVSDHELFEAEEDFADRLDIIMNRHEESDVLILVINNSPREYLSVEIEPAIPGVSLIFGSLTDHAYRIANQLVIEMESSEN